MRTWPWWITLLLLALTLGYFWLLNQGTTFVRVAPDEKTPPAHAKP